MICRTLSRLFAVALIAAACDETTGNLPSGPLSPIEISRGFERLEVSPSVAALAVGGSASLSAMVTDTAGRVTAASDAQWSSDDAGVVTVLNGVLTAKGTGYATVTAVVGDLVATARVRACGDRDHFIVGVDPPQIIPDVPFTIVGCDLPLASAHPTVTIAGIDAAVTRASDGFGVTAVLPRKGLGCFGAREARLVLRADGFLDGYRHRLAVARQLPLLPGESISLVAAKNSTCVELSEPGSRYLVALTNLAPSPAEGLTLVIGGATGMSLVPDTLPQQQLVAGAARLSVDGIATPSATAPDETGAASEWAARRVAYEANSAASASLGDPGLPASSGATPRLSIAPTSLVPGSTNKLRVWRPSSASCGSYTEVDARTVFTGDRVVVLEDVRNAAAGTMDDILAELGHEFDATVYPRIRANFGDPLALDSRLDSNGRILLLISRDVNALSGFAAFVIVCDFYARSLARSSNEAEVIYLHAPTSSERGFPDNGELTPERWHRRVRNVVMHETKHVASYAERLSRRLPMEEYWLEEGTAMVAEELWGREVYDIRPGEEVNYGRSIYCDIRPTESECGAKPFALWEHFRHLNSFQASSEYLTPVSQFTPGDFTVYGSTWGLLRWLMDQHAGSEASFLRRLTLAPHAGIRGLENALGKEVRPLLGDWMMALALEYYPDFTPLRRELTFPSWNTKDIFAGMHLDRPNSFPYPAPLQIRREKFGTFATVVNLRTNTTAIMELSGEQTKGQILGFSILRSKEQLRDFSLTIVRLE